jgi:hypothetical protein
VDDTTNPHSERLPAPARVSAAQVRVGDAERQDAATQLQAHFAAGRLTWDELDERLAQAWAARTAGELSALFVDLPVEQAAAAPAAAARAPAAVMAGRRRPRFHPIYALPVVLIAVAVLMHSLALPPGLILIPFAWVFLAGGARRHHGGPSHGRRHGHGAYGGPGGHSHGAHGAHGGRGGY